ncbi:MAG: DNA topoisomerase IV subunit B, partial [Carnobacterium sp.]|nr:DNA topoisomerase IV subunit B [Carnobacterium sp.]
MPKKIKTAYDDTSIQVLEGLEAVRKRPGMYIGSTDTRGLHHLVYEIVDNSVDEALSGYGDEIKVTLHKDNSISVKDNGRGMPTGMHASGIPTVQVIFTILHAGGKFGQEGGYKTSGGLHGVGASVVNALSEWLTVTIVRDGVEYQQTFINGGKPSGTLTSKKTTRQKNGTTVHFKPDTTIFSTIKYSYDVLSERLRESAFLLKNLRIELIDERNDRSDVFHYEEGIKEFVAYLNEDKDTLTPIAYFSGENNQIEVEFSFQYNDGYSENILSFVNNVRTKDGGTHESSMKTA